MTWIRSAAALFASAALVAGAMSSAALAADSAAPAAAPSPAARKPAAKKPPEKYDLLRFREDWSPLLDTCDRCDFSDRLKAMSLGSCVWLNVGGQARLRWESFENQNFGAIADADDDWLLMRFRLHADLHVGDHVRAYVEGIYADQDEREAGPRAVDENHGDLLDAFVDVTGCVGGLDAGLRVGRYELNYGKQRVVGALDWANTRRSYEGALGWLKDATWRLDAFVNRPVIVSIDEFDEPDDDALFAGAYYTNTSCKTTPWDVYALYLHRDEARWLGVADVEDRVTLGARANGPFDGTRFDWDAEAAYQFGTFGSDSISAAFATVELGWNPCGVCLDPRLALGADWASGDGDGAGGTLGTYNQLFPTGHMWLGYVDVIGRQNVVAGRVTATGKPFDCVTLRLDVHGFWRASEDDGVYNAAGALLRGASGSSERFIGTEVDATVKWTPNRHWDVELGYGHFSAGDFIEDTGAHDDVDFVWLSTTFTF